MANTMTQPALSFLAPFMAPFNALGRALMSMAEAQQINGEAKALYELSDEQLAQRGLTRDQIGIFLTRKFAHL